MEQMEKQMKIALAYSSKSGLMREFQKHQSLSHHNVSEDFFAEGDSMETIQAVMDAIRSLGHEVVGIEADDDAPKNLSESRPDLVINIAEGLIGDFRESYIPLLCERLGIPYTGSDPLTLGICLNKIRTKEILMCHQIPTPPFQVFYPGEPVHIDHLLFPAIVKPSSEGSSKGIENNSVVKDPISAKEMIIEKLLKYKQPIIVESFLSGSEFTVAVWGNQNQIEVLPIVAIRFEDLPEGAWPMYSYEAKWVWDIPEQPLQIFQCPAIMSAGLQQQIESLAKKAYHILSIRDWCRIDIRLDENGIPNILELNPLPGILPKPEDNSCFPKAARTAGYSYPQMIEHLISTACRRIGMSEYSDAPAHRV
jgi:D-alanine-D-alanine ligase